MGKTKVRQVGGANGLILPKKIMKQAAVELGTELDISVDENGNIVISKISDRSKTLKQIDNLEPALFSDDISGKEVLLGIVASIEELVVTHMNSHRLSISEVFNAYKSNDAAMMFYTMTGGIELGQILSRTVKE